MPLWNTIVKEYYLTNFGEAEDMVPKHCFKKLLEETLIKMNADVSVQNKAKKRSYNKPWVNFEDKETMLLWFIAGWNL